MTLPSSLRVRSWSLVTLVALVVASGGVTLVYWSIDRSFNANVIASELSFEAIRDHANPSEALTLAQDVRDNALRISVRGLSKDLWSRTNDPADRLQHLHLEPPADLACRSLDIGVDGTSGRLMLSVLPQALRAAKRCAHPWRLSLRTARDEATREYELGPGEALQIAFDAPRRTLNLLSRAQASDLRAVKSGAARDATSVFLKGPLIDLDGIVTLSALNLEPAATQDAEAGLTAAVDVELSLRRTLADPAWIRSRLLTILGGTAALIASFLGLVNLAVLIRKWLSGPPSPPPECKIILP